MRRPTSLLTSTGILLLIAAGTARAQTEPLLNRDFTLGGPRTPGTAMYSVESHLTTFGADGTRTGSFVYRLSLRCTVAGTGDDQRQSCTALDYTIQRGEAEPVRIPSVVDWTYEPRDDAESTFGIDPRRFDRLVDSQGAPVPVDQAYHVYNSFIDFHMFDRVFAARTATTGIQDLRRIDDRVVHEAAFSEVAVPVSATVREGSFFRNGEITLHFKGLSVVDGRPSALIGYDSGASSFRMVMDAMPDFRVTTTGSSHYRGDFYVDLETNWFNRATLYELVVSETSIPIQTEPIQSIIERDILIALDGFEE